jgi:hypothetical protein
MPGALGWAEIPLYYVLLQPAAHWLLLALAIQWWTWPGLLLTATFLAANSLIACGLVALLSRRFAPWSGPS